MARTSDAHAVELFESSRSRVRTIALAHSLAWQHAGAGESLSAYLLEVTRHAAGERSVPSDLSVDLHVDRVPLGFDVVVTLGLLVHELVIHAFQLAAPLRPTRLSVELTRLPDGELSLLVCDDSPARESSPAETDGLAWRLAGLLAEQLSGELALRPGAAGGHELSVRFPLPREDATWRRS